MSAETEALDDRGSELEAEADLRTECTHDKGRMKRLYNKASRAGVGKEITCPTCEKKHTKTTYHKVFCTNAKTNKRDNCKDRYWNIVDDRKAAWGKRTNYGKLKGTYNG